MLKTIASPVLVNGDVTKIRKLEMQKLYLCNSFRNYLKIFIQIATLYILQDCPFWKPRQVPSLLRETASNHLHSATSRFWKDPQWFSWFCPSFRRWTRFSLWKRSYRFPVCWPGGSSASWVHWAQVVFRLRKKGIHDISHCPYGSDAVEWGTDVLWNRNCEGNIFSIVLEKYRYVLFKERSMFQNICR